MGSVRLTLPNGGRGKRFPDEFEVVAAVPAVLDGFKHLEMAIRLGADGISIVMVAKVRRRRFVDEASSDRVRSSASTASAARRALRGLDE